MIQVEVLTKQGDISHIKLIGHANQADHGDDVVCAGASSCFIGALNALDDSNNFEISYDSGYGSVEVKEVISAHDEIVLEVLVKQLECISHSYPQFLKINKKEGAK